jgi:Papain family cysteine protease
MAKTNVPDSLIVAGNPIRTNAKPDAYDLRDLEYRPMLRPLRPVMDARPANGAFKVLTQDGQSCTGHAIATVINTVLARQAQTLRLPQPELVSPYMLYRMARRYDEFLGEDDEGSSLRGAFKGWLRHGVALEREWQALVDASHAATEVDFLPDLDNPAFIASCRKRPLGAYYRVNAYRLDDMQSAVNELHAVAVSAAIHRGWETPVMVTTPLRESLAVIRRDRHATALGGHAFAIVGYNEIGFLVQNSWGESWGNKGFATLLYDDWLQSAYDAWVCRPGVPSTPTAAPSVTSQRTTSGDVVLSGGPNMTLLRPYVVNTGNNGQLSTTGKFTSTPEQLDEMFANMATKHAAWSAADNTTDRHVVLYAHGGVIDENAGLNIAQHQLGWWLQNHVYPISFAWESGAFETIGDAIGDALHRFIPFGGIGFDFEEHFDRFVEGTARKFFGGLWTQMKDNAEQASDIAGPGDIRGGTEIGRRLHDYIAANPGATVRIHLAGHSAGTIFLCSLAQRLVQMGLDIESVAFMGGAATNGQVEQQLLPAFHARAGLGRIKRFTTFNLAEKWEQDDRCPLGDHAWYHKSLLYLVARGLEPDPDPLTGMVPVVGLQLALATRLSDGRTLGQVISDDHDDCDARMVIAPTGATEIYKSDAHGHADFDNDSATMTSILMRILAVDSLPRDKVPYRQDLPVSDLPEAAPVTAPPEIHAQPVVATTVPEGAAAKAAADARAAVAVLPEIAIPPEAAIAAQGDSPDFEVLWANGYRWSTEIAIGDGHTNGAAADDGANGKEATE